MFGVGLVRVGLFGVVWAVCVSMCACVPTHILVAQLKPGLFPIGEDLPHDDAEAPHVTLRSELPVHDALWGHPADGQHGVTSDLEANQSQMRSQQYNATPVLRNDMTHPAMTD